MTRLRAPDGCPWDREQTLASIKPFTLEEAYEVLEAIDANDMRGLCEELGDYMLQAVFYAQIASESGHFSIGDSLQSINEKLIRRHPHVFGTGKADTTEDVKKRWDEIKNQEKAARGEKPRGLLDGVPKSLPALHQSQELTKKAAKVGFDWPDATGALAKVREEFDELEQAASPQQQEEEFGDLLFALINVARFWKIDSEQALLKASRKFRQRFAYIEAGLAKQQKTPEQSTLEEMDTLWNQAKAEGL
jgi:tetrapyrrole methylase family protein / MazG family protein